MKRTWKRVFCGHAVMRIQHREGQTIEEQKAIIEGLKDIREKSKTLKIILISLLVITVMGFLVFRKK